MSQVTNINVYTVPLPINLVYGPANGWTNGSMYNIFGGQTIQTNQLIIEGRYYRICQGNYSIHNPGVLMKCSGIVNWDTSSSTPASAVSGSTSSSLEFKFE